MKKHPSRSERFLLLTCALFLFTLTAGYCQSAEALSDLSRWYRETRNAEAYRSIEPDLRTLFAGAAERELPHAPLVGRLREGAVKNVPPERLYQAVREEFDRLAAAHLILRRVPSAGPGEPVRTEAVSILAIYLRTDLGHPFIESLLRQAAGSGRSVQDGLELLGALVEIRSVSGLGEKELEPFAQSVLDGKIPPESYRTLSSLFLRARLAGMNDSEILRILTHVLERNGGIIQIEQELNRRTRLR